MLLSEIESLLQIEPFRPLVLTRNDGTTIDIPFKHVAVPVRDGLLIFEGVQSPDSHRATGKSFVAFERIIRIEPKARHKEEKRRK